MENLQLVSGLERPEEIGALFTEYTRMLVDCDSRFQQYLDIQQYDEEVRHLEKKYGPPAGRLYLALCNGEAAGCAALRPLDGERCELKRLYVRPAFRGRGLGRLLTEQILRDAREIGYACVLLDTMPCLTAARRMYRELGFYEIPCYNDSPLDDTVFLQLDLTETTEK